MVDEPTFNLRRDIVDNPFARKPKTPMEQALAVAGTVRSDAAAAALKVRDGATRAGEALAEASPLQGSRRMPAFGAAVAAGAGAAVALRKRAGSSAGDSQPAASDLSEPPTPPAGTEAVATPPAVGTAAATATPSSLTSEPEPAIELEPEQSAEPEAKTPESDPAASPSETPTALDGEAEEPMEPKETPESESAS